MQFHKNCNINVFIIFHVNLSNNFFPESISRFFLQFCRFCAVMATNFGDAKIIRSHCLRLISVLLEVDGLENPSILDMDAFGLLIALTFSLPSLFSKGKIFFKESKKYFVKSTFLRSTLHSVEISEFSCHSDFK